MEKAYSLKRTLLIFLLIGGFSLDDAQLLILDVRTTGSWQASDKKIKGAVRKNPKTFDSWANDLPKNKFLALY